MNGLTFLAVLLMLIGITFVAVGMRKRGNAFLAELRK